MTLVLDASVWIKWLLNDPLREEGTARATELVRSVIQGEQRALQPAHWLLEVAAVLARESPVTAIDDVTMLSALELETVDDPLILRRGCELAIRLRQHLFDTLYHGIALEASDAVLITADDRYFRAARPAGRILHLMQWQYARGPNATMRP
jgi:predicted nucleic acid-binding protein